MPMGGSLPYESRSECIYRYIRRLTRETRDAVEDYSLSVLQAWQARTPDSVRLRQGADFKELGPVSELMRANGKKIRRWMSEEVSARPSVDVEESLVLGLPEPYRSACLQELAARYGGLFVAAPTATPASSATIADLMRTTGAELQALAPLLADGRIDHTDDPALLAEARRHALAAQSVLAGLLVSIDAALSTRTS